MTQHDELMEQLRKFARLALLYADDGAFKSAEVHFLMAVDLCRKKSRMEEIINRVAGRQKPEIKSKCKK